MKDPDDGSEILNVLSNAFMNSVSERPRYRTTFACEGSTLNMDCEPGHVINLIRANYGRFSITICNEHGNTEWSVNCMSRRSHRVLHDKCSQRQNCSVAASTRGFGDPCPGTLKYLEAQFQCVPAHLTNYRPVCSSFVLANITAVRGFLFCYLVISIQ
ncbi:D-galactoside/L-rhamnose binding SUEL lectin domain [Trinorchestia longiramus]|nr:D-galactoside/L-rhamnose binding SUEL lectin domain [Trinorchestia longiramus]